MPSGPSPQSGLSLRIGDVGLHVPDDGELLELADLASRPEGVLPRAQEHFVSWLAGQSRSDIRRRLITTANNHRDLTTGPGWTLDLAVEVGGVLVGMQSLAGFDRWPAVRNVGTSSWLAREAQRRGIGTRARCAVLDLAFGRLDARAAFSWALPTNAASIGVSTRLGYQLIQTADLNDPTAEAKYQLTAETWREHRPPTLPQTLIVGAEGLIDLLHPRHCPR